MTAVCLDTSAYSAFKRGDDDVRSYLERADRILVPTVVLGELSAVLTRDRHFSCVPILPLLP